MDIFFGKTCDYGPFELFGVPHLIAIAAVIGFILVIVFRRKKMSEKEKRNWRYGMAAALVLNECSWHFWNLYHGIWNIQEHLPLHLCSVLIWLGAYMLIKRNYTIFEFAFLLGIPGALQAILTPDLGQFTFPHIRYYQIFISHGLIIASTLYMAFVEGFRPTTRSIVRVLIFSNVYMAAVGLVNWAVGGNYLFIAHKPVTASLLDMLPPWPYYIAIIELLGIVFCLLMYLPYAIRDWRSKRKLNVDLQLKGGLDG